MSGCILADVRVGSRIYVYTKSTPDGQPVDHTIDLQDAMLALWDADLQYYWCKHCDQEWPDWNDCKAHLATETAAPVDKVTAVQGKEENTN